ncbi:MAG TPA: BTAD domain-containing putative transcriptional regulator [Thermodesulfobacteriota bacterium]|nr:BTAD domain-containing putative transcriptional regulator [Thermodesulfobacteriota bacterium]
MGKFSRPILPDIFLRKRLFELLDCLRKQPVIWVSGPAGCGKTTLVSSYFESRQIPCLWYQIDEGDKDPATFFYYLAQAAKKASPRRKVSLPLFTPEFSRGLPAFTQWYFEKLFDLLKIPTILVFDNFHEVPEESLLPEIILNSLTRLPEGINIFILGRREPPPALIRLRANHQMAMMGWDELRLTLAEAEGIIQLRGPELRSRKMIQDLHGESDGWAAGLVLMMEGAKRGKIESRDLENLSREEVFDYFASEILTKTQGEIQNFLLQTAHFPKMTAKMAENLTGLPSSGQILSQLNKDNYFTEKRIIDGESIYQFHLLFREFLLARAENSFSEQALFPLRQHAAILLEEDGQLEASIVLLQRINEWDAMIRLIAKHAPSMVSQGRHRVLKEWLQSIPHRILEDHPWLLLWMGSCHQLSSPAEARSYFEKAFAKFKNQNDATGSFLALSGIVDSIAYEANNFKYLDSLLPAFEDLLQRFKEFPSEEIELQFAEGFFSAMVLGHPQHPEIEKWAEQLHSLADRSSEVGTQIRAFASLLHYSNLTANLEEAAHFLDSMERLTQQKGTPLWMQSYKMLDQATYYFFSGFHQKGLKTVAAGLELSRETGIHIFDRLLLCMGVACCMGGGDYSGASKFLETLAASPYKTRWDTAFYHYYKARENLFRRNLNQASFHMDTALALVEELGQVFDLAQFRLMKAFVMHELGNRKEAEQYWQQSNDLACRIKYRFSEFRVYLVKALFAFDQNQESVGLSYLRKALTLGKEKGYFAHTIDRPDALANLCIKALEAEIEVDYVQGCIRRLKIIPEIPPRHLESWPWPVKIFTLGRFGIFHDEKPLGFSRKVPQKTLAMLKVMIALGGKEVKEEQLSDILWPEADGDEAHYSFKTTQQRLRQLIGHENAIRYKEGRLTLDDRHCWVDVWAFEWLLEQAEAEKKRGSAEKAVHWIEKAIGLYKGPFLADEIEQSWMISARERWRSRFIRNLIWLGHHWQGRGEWEKAIESYQRGLEIDEVAEDLYQQLMICYRELGQRAEALSIYQRCRKTLSTILGIDASPQTEVIYKSLNSGVKI